MRKWCPEPLDRNGEPTRPAGSDFRSFSSGTSNLVARDISPPGAKAGFEKDLALTGGRSLWDLLNQEERDSLIARTRSSLQEEFEAREKELEARHLREIADIRAHFTRSLECLSDEIKANLDRERQDRAAETTGLALALAKKIIRDNVDIDREFLTRTVETVLFKIDDSRPLTAILHPEDAQFLQDNTDLMARLRIGSVVPDRRVEKGGCLIRAGLREWDATISSQLDTLGAILEESLAAAEIQGPAEPGGEDDPSLD